MSEPLSRRCALTLLVAMAVAAVAGLIAWGPVLLVPAAHAYADARAWGGLPNAANVLASLPLLAAAVWGFFATRASRWSHEVRRPWTAFHLCAGAAATVAAVYHAAPGDASFVLAHALTAAGFVFLGQGVLAERVHPGFGSTRALVGAGLLVVLACAVVLAGAASGQGIDMRPFMLLEVLPVLLIPAGALWLPGAHTRASDWVIMLVGYGVAKAFDAADAVVLSVTGWISGHGLMHLILAAVAGWLAYCAATARPRAGAPDTRRHTSLNTSG
jgi:hypothetical protein